MTAIFNGIDVLLADPQRYLRQRPFALVTGSAVIDASGDPVWRALKRCAGAQLRALWSLQHGFCVDQQDNMRFASGSAPAGLGLEVRELYQRELLPSAEHLNGIELLVVDVFDVGCRVYTFLNHMVQVLQFLAATRPDIEVLVLDRPNPLGGDVCEGNLCVPEYFSIVGMAPVPMRHGLTAAEYLGFAASYHRLPVELENVACRGWQRQDLFSGHWTYPSPNMPALQTAFVYPGAVLLEGTTLSEGRGTTRPFEMFGAPYLDHLRLADELNGLSLEGVRFIPLFFKPEFGKYAGEVCRSVLVQIVDRERFRSFCAYYEAIRLVNRLHPNAFGWQRPPYEFETRRPPLDMIAGSDWVRRAIEADIPFAELQDAIAEEIARFREASESRRLYP